MILQELLLSSLLGSKYMFALNFNKVSNWVLSGEYTQGIHFSAYIHLLKYSVEMKNVNGHGLCYQCQTFTPVPLHFSGLEFLKLLK